VLVSVERDFGQFALEPEDMPDGGIWLRPQRISQKRIGELLAGLCAVLLENFPENPYDFHEKIVEVYVDRVEIRIPGGDRTSYDIPTGTS
jgi:hypothetical protein